MSINESMRASDTDGVDRNADKKIASLQERIAALVSERQRLRAVEAPASQLEANRAEIARLQQELSRALIALYLHRPYPGLA